MYSELRIASRKSTLAKLQAYLVGHAIKKIKPEKQIVYSFRESLGDKDLTSPLWKMPEKGVFTRDFREDLISEKIDIVVHSFKDLELDNGSQTTIIPVLGRADQRDILLFKLTSLEKPPEIIKIFSSSPRREYNLKKLFSKSLPKRFQNKKIEFIPIRGNIQTRLDKWQESDSDGIVIAKAAIDRLLSENFPEAKEEEFVSVRNRIRAILEKSVFQILPLSENPNAPAQGALAVEIKSERIDLIRLLQNLRMKTVAECVLKEREILSQYGGGCHQKIGVSVSKKNYGLITIAKGLSDSGEEIQKIELSTFQQRSRRTKNQKLIWPEPNQKTEKKRKIIQQNLPQGNLWVSRSSAWQDEWVQKDYNYVIWTAGIKTFYSLAEKDIWVSGTADGLGENDPHMLDIILKNPKFKKLTHQKSKDIDSRLEKIFTYETEDITFPDLTQKDFFYWMSASEFDDAIDKFPSILNKFHSCGPGLTYNHIIKKTGQSPDIFLNIEEFWNHHFH